MPVGPGKYDDLCTYVREKSNAAGAIVLIIGGDKGQGFSVQVANPLIIAKLPEMLETMAREIRQASGASTGSRTRMP